MSNYRDPKVTTPTKNKSQMGKWIGVVLAVILALLLLAWLLGALGNDESDTVPVVTEEPATTPPAATPTAPAD